MNNNNKNSNLITRPSFFKSHSFDSNTSGKYVVFVVYYYSSKIVFLFSSLLMLFLLLVMLLQFNVQTIRGITVKSFSKKITFTYFSVNSTLPTVY